MPRSRRPTTTSAPPSAKTNLTALAPLEVIERLVRFTWDYFVEHPEFMMMLNSENLHKARHLKKSKQIPAMNSPLIATSTDPLAFVKPGHHPQCPRSAAVLHLDRRDPPIRSLERLDALGNLRARRAVEKQEMKQRIEHIVDLVITGLRP